MPSRLAVLAVLAALAAAPRASAQHPNDVAPNSCIQCHKEDSIRTMSHTMAKDKKSCENWFGGTWVTMSGGYCCGGMTSSHCPNDGMAPKKKTFDGFPGGSYISPGDASVIKKWVDNSTSSTTAKTPVVKKPAPPKKPAAVAYWCDPATGKVVAGKEPKGGTKVASKTSPCAKADKNPTASTSTVVPVAALLLTEAETRWLTKVQAAAYSDARTASTGEAGHKAVDDQYRKLVKDQTRPEAASAYAAAIAPPAADKIKTAVGDVEMWGGKDVKSVVGLYQEKASSGTAKLLEIQLTKADYDMLSKASPAALGAYKAARGGADGRGAGSDFKASLYDPVALRLSLVAALKSINKEAPGGPKKETEKPKDDGTAAGGGILTDKEKAVLTPKELKTYQALIDAATVNGKLNEKDPNLLKEAARLRALIAKEGRLNAKPMPSSDEMTEAKFKDLPLYQKQQFCKDYRSSGAAAAKDTKSKELDNGSDAKKGLESSAPTVGSGKTSGKTGASSSAWSKEDRIAACGKVPEDGPGAIDGETHSNMTAAVPAVANDVDKDDEAKGKNKWLTEPLIISAVQGSLVGLLIGSLFGPLGLILGPIIGAVAFYGISKLKE